MKLTKKQLAGSIIALLIVLVSLAVTICDWAIPLNIYVHPVLTFFMCLFGGLGIMCLVYGIIGKSPWYFFLCAVLLGLSGFYIAVNNIAWWISLIIVFAFWVIIGILSYITAGNKTEDIALNKSPEYKDYKTRKAEKEAAEAAAEPEELPKIKSFKD